MSITNDLVIVETEDRTVRDPEKVYDGSTVPKKYRGTAADQHDMIVLGKKQVLRRSFKLVTMVGFASTALVAWEFLTVISIYSLQDGGTAIVFWGLIVGCFGMTFVYASLAEMASMFPIAGGQYHWVSELAPPSMQKFLSYAVGWLTAMGWQVYLAGICFTVGGVIQGLIVLNNLDTYVPESWQGTLLTMAVVWFVVIFNTIFAVRLPFIEGTLLIVHVAGLFAIVIPLWVLAPRGNIQDTILTFTTTAGWDNIGIASLIGVINPICVLIGYDCIVHMSEEVKDASYVQPRALMWSVVPNALMAVIMGTTFVFTIGDVDSALKSPTNEPFIQAWFNATQSYAGTNAMVFIIILMLTSACISEVATASRQIWSFARDGGLPFANFLSYVTPGWNIPLRAVFVSVVISSLLSLINIGSYVALNAINSLAVNSLLFSYTVTISCMIWRRLRGAPLPPRKWSLGKYGLAVNVAALCFIIPLLFFAFWPVSTPVTAAGFNWSSTMFAGVLSIAALYYVVRARHVYTGPVVNVKRDE